MENLNYEKEATSVYFKILFKFEKELLKFITSSQTNEDRKALFLFDNPNIESRNVSVYPNFPPENWWTDFGQYKSSYKGGIIKLIHVGVLDSETMYLEEILTWVKANSDTLVLTLHSQQYSEKTKALIDKYSGSNIFLKQAINYYELPQELVKHDLGLVLYKGHILNHVYSVPNKVYEYLSCGLKVIAPNTIISIQNIKNAKIRTFDFTNLNSIQLTSVLSSKEISIEYKHKSMILNF